MFRRRRRNGATAGAMCRKTLTGATTGAMCRKTVTGAVCTGASTSAMCRKALTGTSTGAMCRKTVIGAVCKKTVTGASRGSMHVLPLVPLLLLCLSVVTCQEHVTDEAGPGEPSHTHVTRSYDESHVTQDESNFRTDFRKDDEMLRKDEEIHRNERQMHQRNGHYEHVLYDEGTETRNDENYVNYNEIHVRRGDNGEHVTTSQDEGDFINGEHEIDFITNKKYVLNSETNIGREYESGSLYHQGQHQQHQQYEQNQHHHQEQHQQDEFQQDSPNRKTNEELEVEEVLELLDGGNGGGGIKDGEGGGGGVDDDDDVEYYESSVGDDGGEGKSDDDVTIINLEDVVQEEGEKGDLDKSEVGDLDKDEVPSGDDGDGDDKDQDKEHQEEEDEEEDPYEEEGGDEGGEGKEKKEDEEKVPLREILLRLKPASLVDEEGEEVKEGEAGEEGEEKDPNKDEAAPDRVGEVESAPLLLKPAEENKTASSGSKRAACVDGDVGDLGNDTTPITLVPLLNSTALQALVSPNPNASARYVDAPCALVFFFLPSCPFSAAAAPAVEGMARGLRRRGVPVYGVDSDSEHSINAQYGVVGTPTLVLYHSGYSVAHYNASSYTPALLATFLRHYTNYNSLQDSEFNVTEPLEGETQSGLPGLYDDGSGGGGSWTVVASWLFLCWVGAHAFLRSRLCARITEAILHNWREAEAHHHQD